MKRASKLLIFAALVAALLGGYWYWQQPGSSAPAEKKAGKSGKGEGRRGPVSVSIVEAKRQSMPVVIDAVGTVESEHTVAVRPQASGVL
ncbi:MAG TPA: hypothetical protein VFI62_05080, partial [Burkholderiales bacterium]|nr:hypothetical protein [Burkholderiales bacterium]